MSVLATAYPDPMAILRATGSSGRTTSAPGMRLTGRGRVVVTTLAVVAATFLTFASQQAVAGQGGGAVHVDTRTVVAGETLWEIAGEYSHPGQDIRDVVDELAELNGLRTSDLRAGQELLVPAP